MPLSWNEIRARAAKFSDEWKDAHYEKGETQTFYNEFFDLEENEEYRFPLAELADNIRSFGFIAGYQQQKYRDQDSANIEASELMSNIHKHLEESGYTGHDLERLLVRIMFCLFAEDTGIFQIESFLRLVEDRTEEDGRKTLMLI